MSEPRFDQLIIILYILYDDLDSKTQISLLDKIIHKKLRTFFIYLELVLVFLRFDICWMLPLAQIYF